MSQYIMLSFVTFFHDFCKSIEVMPFCQVQEAALRSMPDIVVATPGRIIDHLRNSMSVDLDDLAVLILDEADRLLEVGFSAEISELVCSGLLVNACQEMRYC